MNDLTRQKSPHGHTKERREKPTPQRAQGQIQHASCTARHRRPRDIVQDVMAKVHRITIWDEANGAIDKKKKPFGAARTAFPNVISVSACRTVIYLNHLAGMLVHHGPTPPRPRPNSVHMHPAVILPSSKVRTTTTPTAPEHFASGTRARAEAAAPHRCCDDICAHGYMFLFI